MEARSLAWPKLERRGVNHEARAFEVDRSTLLLVVVARTNPRLEARENGPRRRIAALS